MAAALEVSLALAPRWKGAELPKLLDRAHSRLVEAVLHELRADDWEVSVEYTFNHFGDRGSVDVLGWHPGSRSLLIVEVKSGLDDIQGTIATLDRKCRVVPLLVTREREWRPRVVARVLVIRDSTTARRRVAALEQTFAASLPARTRDVRRWLSEPTGRLAGIWFLPDITGHDAKQDRGAHRVRQTAPDG
jgi:hypothetical protein